MTGSRSARRRHGTRHTDLFDYDAELRPHNLSARMLERARQLTDGQGLSNVTYQRADAQVHRFPPTHFDLCISRFGAMFFADPVAAFTNIGRALRPAARLVLLVWQDRDRNEWASAIRRTLTAATAAPTSGADPFSLADPTVTEGILAAAGFTEVSFTDVHDTGSGVYFDSRAWIMTARRH